MAEKIFTDLKSEVERIVEDSKIGLKGFLVIDSEIGGKSCGGLRMTENVSLEEMRDLAKAMTLKHAFLGFSRGGAKAGIVAPENISRLEKEKLIKRFAELIKDHLIDRNYLSGPDMNTDSSLINVLYQHAGVLIPKRSTGSPNSGYFTALGVFACLETCLDIKNMKLENLRVAIEGFGGVGGVLAKKLYERGAIIVAVSNQEGAIYKTSGLNIPEIIELKARDHQWLKNYKGADIMPKEKICELAVEVFCPCAISGTINRGNVDRVKAKIVCAGANNPVTMAADNQLFNQGTMYLPDFVTNCGGVLGNAVEFAGLNEYFLIKLFETEIAEKIKAILKISKARNISPRQAGIELAEKCFNRIKKRNTEKKVEAKIMTKCLAIFKKGFVPKFLARPLVALKLKKMVGSNQDIYKSIN